MKNLMLDSPLKPLTLIYAATEVNE